MDNYERSIMSWIHKNFPHLSNVKRFAKGGQKTVFFATCQDGSDVVLKLIHQHVDLDRFKREIAAVNQISSPRVPMILHTGKAPSQLADQVWVIEERVQGVNLRARLVDGPLGGPDLLRLALHISEILVAAEGAGIVHRDIKPDNIVMDTDGDFWLLDFGIARLLEEESLTSTTSVFGPRTWGYAPVEQVVNRKKKIDTRADLYALGVTLYECSTGTNPLTEGTRDSLEVLTRQESWQWAPLHPLDSLGSVSASFSDLVLALTQRRRIHRPRHAREVYSWIREIREGVGVQ